MDIKKLILLFTVTLVVSISCRKTDTDLPDADLIQFNVSYGTDAAQKMDVYLPAGRTSTQTKVIVMIHGGGWTSGDKADFNSFVDTLKRRLPGYAVFNINYRLSANPNNIFPTQERDVKSAMEYIYGKAAEYRISEKYVLMGASAGAHLAMLQAYKYDMPVKPKAVVSFFGPSDLTDMYNNPVGGNPSFSLALAIAVGTTPTLDPSIYTESSPLNFITSSSAIPTILIHGGVDPLVNPSQSEFVQSRLTSAGISNEYVFYPSGGHGDWNAATYTDAFNKIQLFLQTHVL